MKNYIFATDFSDNARSALDYALPYVKKRKGRLILFHAFDFANPYVEAPVYMLEEMNQGLEHKAKESLREWQQLVHTFDADIPCTYVATRGSFVRSLLDLSEKEESAAIFMGTKGASGLKRIFIGTQTAAVIEKATCPVLAIPDEITFAGIHSIAYATDYQAIHPEILLQVAELATAFEAKLEIVHVSNDEVEVDLEVYDWYQKAAKESLSHIDISFKVVHNKSVHEGISTYVDFHQPDLVVMAMHDKSWMERLLSGSNSKKQAYVTQKPLLVLHEGVKEKIQL